MINRVSPKKRNLQEYLQYVNIKVRLTDPIIIYSRTINSARLILITNSPS